MKFWFKSLKGQMTSKEAPSEETCVKASKTMLYKLPAAGVSPISSKTWKPIRFRVDFVFQKNMERK